MDIESLSTTTKNRSRRRFQQPLSSHIDFDADIQSINQDIKRYRALYFSIGTYSGTFTLLQFGFVRFLRWSIDRRDLVDLKVTIIRSTIFLVPWIFQPVFGYISDVFFPFFRRFKGYAITLGILSILATGINILTNQFSSLNWEITLCFFQVVCLIWVDSLAQGMIMVALRFEARKDQLLSQNSEEIDRQYKALDSMSDTTLGLVIGKPVRISFKYAKSFGYFTAWITLVRGIFEFIAAFMFVVTSTESSDPTYLKKYIQMVYIITLPFLGIMVLCFIFIQELRQQTLISRKKIGSIFGFIKRVSPAYPWAILGLAISVVVNPSNTHYGCFATILRQVYLDDDPELLTTLYIAPIIAGIILVGMISSSITFCKSKRASLYLLLQILIQIVNQGGMYYIWLFDRNQIVSPPWLLMVLFTIAYVAELGTLSLPLLAVIENSIHRIPEDHEAFAVNLMSGLIFFGWVACNIITNSLRAAFNIQQYNYDQLNYYTTVTLVYTLGTIVWFAIAYCKQMLDAPTLPHIAGLGEGSSSRHNKFTHSTSKVPSVGQTQLIQHQDGEE